MKNSFKAAIAAIALILAGLVAAPPAQASTQTGLCWVGGDQYARLSVSVWNSSYTSNGVFVPRWTWHMDLNSHGNIIARQITLTGASVPGYNDVYVNVGSGVARTVAGIWNDNRSGETSPQLKCYVTIDPT